ncbi:MAG: glucan 1,4-alpha-glucosidase [Acidobacteriia bacterium]|nr:glucan 1,4-alpha-glucosidase [Terriglobia bacterium]
MTNGSQKSLAFGAPGMSPRWTSSTKDGVGTAYSASSCVWFTLSHGILNEVYYPTIDRPQIRDMQFLITDGQTFFHEERRHLKTEVEELDRWSLGYRIINSDPQGRYRLIKQVIADPHQPCVLIRTQLEGDRELLDRLQVFALVAPHLEVGGWGNSIRRIEVLERIVLLAWKARTCMAMGADVGFGKTSCGYVGTSDGWQDLNHNLRMDWEFDRAENGNVAGMGELNLSEKKDFTVALAFGDSPHAAIATLVQSLAIPFSQHQERFGLQWRRVAEFEDLERFVSDGGLLYRTSRQLLLAHEDKTFAGALIASASIPWGDCKGDEDLGGYHLVWTRDAVQSATALLASGRKETARRALVYLACSQAPDGGFPQNFWIDGTPYWRGIQLDEVAFPVMLAWRLWNAGGLADFDPYPMVLRAARFLVQQSPVTQQERWEENSGYSPSTLAAIIAALICAADFARSRQQESTAVFLEQYADFLETHIEQWTVTTQGSLVPGISRHYIRIHPSTSDSGLPDEDPNAGLLLIPNRPPGAQFTFAAKDIVEAGFLELVRYGIRRPGDTLIEDSLRVVDSVLKVETPCGPCWRRYNYDGYGQRPDGGPFKGWGQGRAWPLLTGERGHYELAAGRDPKPFTAALERLASGAGMLPEQVWDEPDRPERRLYLGRPAGSAMPLMWAHAEYLTLLRSVADGQGFDLIEPVAARYLRTQSRAAWQVWKPDRRVPTVNAGSTLRILAFSPFRLRWSRDGWQTVSDTSSTNTELGSFVDLQVPPGQGAPVSFTFYWLADARWEGQDYSVEVRSRN